MDEKEKIIPKNVGFKRELHQRLWIQLANPYVYRDRNIAAAIGNYHNSEWKAKTLKKIFHRHLLKIDPYYRNEFRKIDPDNILYFWRDIACCYGCLATRYETCSGCPVEVTCKSDYYHWSDLLEVQENDKPFTPKMARKLALLAYHVAFLEPKNI
jgi:hypothetical protein